MSVIWTLHDECVTRLAGKLRQWVVSLDDPCTELLMDASEVLDVSGDFMKPEPQPHPPPPPDGPLAIATDILPGAPDFLPRSTHGRS